MANVNTDFPVIGDCDSAVHKHDIKKNSNENKDKTAGNVLPHQDHGYAWAVVFGQYRSNCYTFFFF